MDYHEALKLTKEGKLVRRSVWGRNLYLKWHSNHRLWIYQRGDKPCCPISVIDAYSSDWEILPPDPILELDDVDV